MKFKGRAGRPPSHCPFNLTVSDFWEEIRRMLLSFFCSSDKDLFMTSVKERLLSALSPGESLPPVDPPGGHYLPFSVAGNLCFLSGYISRSSPNEFIVGKVTDAKDGAAAARTCALGHLSLLNERCGGLDNVQCFHKVGVFVNGENGYSDSPAVGNGYTDFICAVFGEDVGIHARSAVTVAGLPFNASVEVEAIVELKDPSLAKRL